MLKFIQIVIFLFASVVVSYSQNISGTVVDNKRIPLVGVNILNINNQAHAHSNVNGQFVLESVNKGDTLQFSYIGFLEKKLVVETLNTPLKIILKLKPINLNEITISPGLDALNLITNIDILTSPVNSSQEVLRKMPGLFIGQHAGGGKAEQIFLRGFDIDHGTDISLTVDGLPINMVSHAHGQGYADLHFIIPETINKLDFGKGPYYASKGNFNTAGYVNFKTKKILEDNELKLETGQFNTLRLFSAFNLLNSNKQKSYLATEFLASDGPFDSPQNFNRINMFAKYSGAVNELDQIGLTASYFTSRWDASGQIPQRAVDKKVIGRFGAIDNTEGGITNRLNVLVNHRRYIDENAYLKNNIYFCNYNFEL